MSNSKVKQQVRPEQDVKIINKLPHGESGLSRKLTGIVPLYATADLPDASKLPDGVLCIDSTLNKVMFTKNGAWVACA